MSAPVHDFRQKLAQGQADEAELDRFFGRFFAIRPATRDEERRGIDRWFTGILGGPAFPVEYKSDRRAYSTHNAFVETVSVDTEGKQGWVYTSQAHYLLYYVPGEDVIYVWTLARLRQQVTRWQGQFPTRQALNDGYRTHGICVPLAEFERHADRVINLADYADGAPR